ncbi:MAG: HK97 gp10 family phage protein [Clostridium sp.]|nr:HK97 gp10 family phage protein [Clostridium sp.]MCM1400252.1 HK97 gp10 family phage protein [Clostridium sp.]MCM1460965.1 HK97 gp10 family phage protein [Bacteroides sp.]
MSNSIKIKPDRLAKEVQSIFSSFEHGVETAVDKAADKVAKGAVKKLKATSPKGHRGKYKKGWKMKKTGKEGTYVYNEEYQLTHLLENGHEIVINGEVRGHADAIPHIAPVEEYVQEEFVDEFERQVKGI